MRWMSLFKSPSQILRSCPMSSGRASEARRALRESPATSRSFGLVSREASAPSSSLTQLQQQLDVRHGPFRRLLRQLSADAVATAASGFCAPACESTHHRCGVAFNRRLLHSDPPLASCKTKRELQPIKARSRPVPYLPYQDSRLEIVDVPSIFQRETGPVSNRLGSYKKYFSCKCLSDAVEMGRSTYKISENESASLLETRPTIERAVIPAQPESLDSAPVRSFSFMQSAKSRRQP